MPAGSPGLLRLALGLLLAAVSSLALSAPATAHSYLNNSNPNDGETLKVAPDRVTLTFSDSVRDTGLGVTAQGPQGGFLLDATAMTKKVIAVWPDESDPGKYTVSYRAVSIDGHVMDGSIAFEIAAAAGSPSPASAGSPPATTTGPSSPTESPQLYDSQESESPEPASSDSDKGPAGVPPWVFFLGALIAAGGIAVGVLRGRFQDH